MSRIDDREPHMSRTEARICAANLAEIEPRNLIGFVLIAIDATGDKPVVTSDLDSAQLVAALAGILAVLTADALGVES